MFNKSKINFNVLEDENKFLEDLSNIADWQKFPFLLAVSGGVDSMVLLNLFTVSNINFSVAHCNFSLRRF